MSGMAPHSSNDIRFAFGANWRRFIECLNPARIRQAQASLLEKTGLDSFAGKTFLDIGCGSGLFSLAARNLGATVHSFDYDPQSVACALELRGRFRPDDSNWTIGQGSVLDRGYIESLRQFDIVYSWGVLHHTGAMRSALENTAAAVKNNGLLFIAIYNDQGARSTRWKNFKRLYVAAPRIVRPALAALVAARFHTLTAIKRAVTRTLAPEHERGMHAWHDAVDWAGGYPFEVAKPEEIFDFCHARGFALRALRTVGGGHGCNEFVFMKQQH
ncbi:MAG: class I SAM-dependent methyltransferase [Elusimicrobiaceae bacterium]|nr:class I SAM-dependent methyltransferase [Elusimicrobiaceae bacterium]